MHLPDLGPSEYEPEGHNWQGKSPGENFPAWHSRQTFTLGGTLGSGMKPALQAHLLLLLDPTGPTAPSGHEVHVVELGASAYFDFSHSSHDLNPVTGLNEPAGQALQSDLSGPVKPGAHEQFEMS